MLARLPSYLPWDRISRDLYVSRLIKGVNRYPIDASVRLLFRLIICENYSTGIRDIRAIVPISSSPYFSISSILSVFFSPHHRTILYPTERKRERGANFTRNVFTIGKIIARQIHPGNVFIYAVGMNIIYPERTIYSRCKAPVYYNFKFRVLTRCNATH